MNNKKLFALLTIATVLAVATTIALFAATTPYQPYAGTAATLPGNPDRPERINALTNGVPLILTNLTTSAISTVTFAGGTNAAVYVSNQPISITSQGTEQLGIVFNLATPFASTSNVTAIVEFSPGGGLWLTTPANQQTVVFPLTGTTNLIWMTNFSAANTVNLKFARLKSLSTTATNALYVTNIYFLR